MITRIISTFVGLCLFIESVEGGECCKAHDGLWSVADNDAMWCEDYCCHLPNKYYCCADLLLQADSWDREDLCGDYFSENVWVPILISLGSVGSIVACCFCCYRCCCRSNQIGGTMVMAPTGGNPNVTVVNTTNTMSHQPAPMMSMPTGGTNMAANPGQAGYDQGQKPNY